MVVMLWLWCRTRCSCGHIHNPCLRRRQLNAVAVAEIAAQTKCQRGELLPVWRVRALQWLPNAHIPAHLRKRRQHLCLDICGGVRQELKQLLSEAQQEAG